MSGFVDECRREWKRLGVPDPAADEMAGDLEADLDEAERDGASPVDLLGTSVHDPRGFAADWANERGLVPRRVGRSVGIRWIVAGGLVALVVIGALISVLVTRGGNSPQVVTPASTSSLVPSIHQGPAIVGTEVMSIALMPDDVRITESTVPRLVGRPSEIAVLIRNSGDSAIARVRVELRVGPVFTASREATIIPRSSPRWVNFKIPRSLHLPTDLTIMAQTLPIDGERNLTNNQRTWHVRLKP